MSFIRPTSTAVDEAPRKQQLSFVLGKRRTAQLVYLEHLTLLVHAFRLYPGISRCNGRSYPSQEQTLARLKH